MLALLREVGAYQQNGLYERHIRPLFPLTMWMAFLDLDEFMYGRKESLASYLQRVPDDIARLEVGSHPPAHPTSML